MIVLSSNSEVYAMDYSNEQSCLNEDVIESADEMIELLESCDSIDAEEAKKLFSSMSKEAAEDYIEYVDREAEKLINEAEPVEEKTINGDTSIKRYKVEVDPLTTVELCLEDRPEPTLISKLDDLFTLNVNAASNGKSLWKAYGNRYFTATYKRYVPTGYVSIKTENHYNVSKNGLKERYADSWIDNYVAGFTTFNVVGDVIKNRVASTVGKYIQVNTKIQWDASAEGILNGGGSFTEYTRVKIDKIDRANKRIKVTHSWGKIR